MANEFVARKGIISLDNVQVTGSISATGGINISGSIASASFANTASYAANAELLDGKDSTIFATTGSNIFSGNQTVCANITTTGTITAQTLVVQTVTSSIVYSSGSNIFGNQLTDTQRFTGSMFITGSTLNVSGGTICTTGNTCFGGMSIINSCLGIGTATPSSRLELSNSSGDTRATITSTGTTGASDVMLKNASGTVAYEWLVQGLGSDGRFRIFDNCGASTGERFTIDQAGNVGVGTASPNRTLDVNGEIRTQSGTVDFGNGTTTQIYQSSNNLTFKVNSIDPAIRITSAGNVGINISAPCSKLHVQFAGTTTTTCMTCLKDGALVLYNANAGSSTDGTVGIFGQNAGALGLSSGIGFSRENSGNWGTQIRFYTHPTVTSEIDVVCERMRITGDGNLGLGVVPSNTYADSKTIEIGASGIIWTEQIPSVYNSMSIGSNYYYDASGNVKYKNTGIAASRFSQYQGTHLWFTATSGTAGCVITFTQAMTLDTCGRLGIGTTSPSTLLYVNGYSSSNWITTLNNTGTSGHQLYFGYNDGTSTRYGLYIDGGPGSGSGNFDFGIGASKFRVMSSGNVGIGTSSPAYVLDVAAGTNGNFATPAARISTSTGGAGGATILQINHTANSVSGLQIAQYGATPGNYTSIINTENSYMLFGTNNSERMRITNTGIACFSCQVCAPIFLASGCVGIGMSSPQTSLHIIKALGNDAFAIGESGTNTRFAIGQEASYTGNYINSRNIDLKLQAYCAGGSGGNIYFQTGTDGTGCVTTKMFLCSTGRVGIGTTDLSTEANLYLGAQGTVEGGQLVLQKGTSCNCATHLDNYKNQFRILGGSDTTSTSEWATVDMINGIAKFNSTLCAPLITSAANSINITGTQFLTTLGTDNALYIITAQPEAGSGTSAAALISSRTNSNPAVQTIVSSSSLSFFTSGYNICLCSNLPYTLSARWGIIRLA